MVRQADFGALWRLSAKESAGWNARKNDDERVLKAGMGHAAKGKGGFPRGADCARKRRPRGRGQKNSIPIDFRECAEWMEEL